MALLREVRPLTRSTIPRAKCRSRLPSFDARSHGFPMFEEVRDA
jgi:hypothetical protein